MTCENEILEIVAKQARVDIATLNQETRLADLKLESIDIIEIIFAIEDKFDITVPYSNPAEMDAAGVSFETVGGMTDAVDKLIADQHASKAV